MEDVPKQVGPFSSGPIAAKMWESCYLRIMRERWLFLCLICFYKVNVVALPYNFAAILHLKHFWGQQPRHNLMILRSEFPHDTLQSLLFYKEFILATGCVNSSPSLFTSRSKFQLTFAPSLSLGHLDGRRSQNLAADPSPSPQESTSGWLCAGLSSELTMGNKTTVSLELLFSPVSNPDNEKIPLRSQSILHMAGWVRLCISWEPTIRHGMLGQKHFVYFCFNL